jgi:hypothetical protein
VREICTLGARRRGLETGSRAVSEALPSGSQRIGGTYGAPRQSSTLLAFQNGGRTGRPQGDRVNVHDFPVLGRGKGIPYGAYEIGEDRAVVNGGGTHDTAEFPVESIRLVETGWP